MADGELEDTVEDQASTARGAPVEPERELVQIFGKMLAVDRTLVRA